MLQCVLLLVDEFSSEKLIHKDRIAIEFNSFSWEMVRDRLPDLVRVSLIDREEKCERKWLSNYSQYQQSFPNPVRQDSTTNGGGDQVEVFIENSDGPDHRDIDRAFARVCRIHSCYELIY